MSFWTPNHPLYRTLNSLLSTNPLQMITAPRFTTTKQPGLCRIHLAVHTINQSFNSEPILNRRYSLTARRINTYPSVHAGKRTFARFHPSERTVLGPNSARGRETRGPFYTSYPPTLPCLGILTSTIGGEGLVTRNPRTPL